MKKNYGLALCSAFLLWLAWPPIPYTALILLVGLIPLLTSIENIRKSAHPQKARKVFRLAFITFFIWNTASIYWIINSLKSILPGGIALLISLIPFGLGALLMSLSCLLFYKLSKFTPKWLAYTGLISFWLTYEFLHQSWDLAFPWMTLGNGFAEAHYFAQWYEFTGVYGGSIWVWLANILIFETWQAYKNKGTWVLRKRMLAGISAAVVLIPVG